MMDEEPQRDFMHFVGLGEGERFSYEAPHWLPQRVVPAFEVIGGTAFFMAPMLFGGQQLRISRLEVGEAGAAFVSCGDALPQHATGRFASTPQSVSDDLSCAATLRQPQPHLIFTPVNK